MNTNNTIRILDTTLRDGEQAPGVNLNTSEKLEIARALENLGVDVIEAGFPASSPGDAEAVKLIAKEIRGSSIAGLCRAVKNDIDICWDSLRDAASPLIHIFLATSDIHMEYKLHMTREQVLEKTRESVSYARSLCPNVEFSPEDGSRTDHQFLIQVLTAAVEAGATIINIPDTVGYSTPEEFGALIDMVRENVPLGDAVLSVHCHDDLGLGVANSLSGIRHGARQIECTINGMGERAGNAALETLVMNLTTRSDFYHLTHRIDTTQIYRVSRLIASISGVEIPPNQPVIGDNAFRHESGIHQHGVMANPMTYEIMTPESVGLTINSMVLGKHSGRHAFVEHLHELGYHPDEAVINEAFRRFKALADRKKEITDRDLSALMGGEFTEAAPHYTLESFQMQSGNKIQSIAAITLVRDGEPHSEAAVGDGPIDAIYHAINRIIPMKITLETYAIKAVTEGADALGEVTVRIRCEDALYLGRGLSSDITEASVLAYINAINRALTAAGTKG